MKKGIIRVSNLLRRLRGLAGLFVLVLDTCPVFSGIKKPKQEKITSANFASLR
jgi:hypothetical protein